MMYLQKLYDYHFISMLFMRYKILILTDVTFVYRSKELKITTFLYPFFENLYDSSQEFYITILQIDDIIDTPLNSLASMLL